MSANQVDRKMIARFMSNKSTPQEANEVSAYLADNLNELDKIMLFETITEDELIVSIQSTKENVYQGIVSSGKVKTIRWKNWMAAACLIGLLSITGYQLLSLLDSDPGVQTVATPTMIRLENLSALDRLFYLPDSSTALLTPNSNLEYAEPFVTNRKINQLAGEIYYSVKADSLHPFTVTANGITTTALGTEFWVKNQKDKPEITVALVAGKVKLGSVDANFPMDEIYLDPGQQCLIDKETGKISVSSLHRKQAAPRAAQLTLPDAEPIAEAGILWTNNEIQFNKVQLQSVFTRIATQYGVTIEYVDADLPAALITGKIFYSDSLDTIMKSICEINQLKFERKEDTLYIRRK